MSQPMYSPPPPPSAPPPPPIGGAGAAQQVQGPAIGLLVVGGIGILVLLGWTLLNVLGTGASFIPTDIPGDASQRVSALVGGAVGIIFALLMAAAYGFVVWAGLQMRQLRKWNAAVAASIIVMIPCVGCCCIIGLPVGIWSLVVLMKPEVKSSFVG